MATGKVNVGGGSSQKLNIFAQLTEPNTKDGIWVKTNEKIKNTAFDDSYNLTFEEEKDPYISHASHNSVSVGDNIYVFGGGNSSSQVYNVKTKIWKALAAMSLGYSGGHSATHVDGKVYLMGGSSGSSGTTLSYYDIANNTWNTLGNLPINTKYHTAVAVEKKIYLMGGSGSSPNSNYSFDTKTLKWTKLADIPYGAIGHISYYSGGYIYIIGGQDNLMSSYRYSIKDNVWEKLNDVSIGINRSRSVLAGDRLYIFGGNGTNNLFGYFEADNQTWHPIATSKSYSTHTLDYIDGKLYIVDGYFCSSYDVRKNVWSERDIMPFSTYGKKAVYVNNKVYVLGNSTTEFWSYDLSNRLWIRLADTPILGLSSPVYIEGKIYAIASSYNMYNYDIASNTWTKMSDTPAIIVRHNAVAIGNKIYILGSENSYLLHYCYDTVEKTWTRLADMPYRFVNGSAVAVGTNIYVNGSTVSENEYYNYCYDTLSGKWTKLSNSPLGLSYHTAVYYNNNIYAIVGSNSKSILMYSIEGNTWRTVGGYSVNIPDTATVIVGSKIYTFGGNSETVKNKIKVFNIESEQDSNSLLIKNTLGLYQTKILTSPIELKIDIDGAIYCDSSNGLKTPVYIGDGYKWSQIR